jgi:hypothetical protein
LVLRERTARELRQWIATAGIADNELTWQENFDLQSIAARDIDSKIHHLLGDAGSVYVQNFLRTSLYRYRFNRLDELLTRYGEPLSVDQIDQLVAWSAAESRPTEFSMSPTIPESVLAKAAAFLSPLQLEKFKIFQAENAAQNSLLEKNQTAAEKGLLQMNPQSAREYEEWVKSKSSKTPRAVP